MTGPDSARHSVLRFVAAPCAICGTLGNADQVYPARFDFRDLNAQVFSARRTPDRVHYRIVRCRACGLLRSDPVADTATLARLYASSEFSYAGELANLRRTYGGYIQKAVAAGAGKGTLVDIGCGNGFVLEEALDLGFAQVIGVEPAADAARKASERVRTWILCDMMRPGLLPEASADLVTMFQVLDHLPDPGAVIAECFRAIRPGGFLLALNHDAGAWSARLMGERSPIFDIQHTYLYDRSTMDRLFRSRGFEPVESGAVWNRYSLQYLLRLAPVPSFIRAVAESFKRVSLSLPLGNLYLIARKPRA